MRKVLALPRRRVLLALTGLVAFAVFVTAAVSSLTPSTFNAGDGNLTVQGSEKDWANIGVECTSLGALGGKGCGLDKPTGQTDNSFGGGSDENEPNPVVGTGSIPNNKSDLSRFYVSNERQGSAEYLYLAWERVQDPTGTTNMDFEFNKNKCVVVNGTPTSDSVCSTNGTTPTRSAGDLLLMYDLSNGGTNPSIAYSRWLTSGSSTLCEAGKIPCWSKRTSIAAGGGGSVGNFEASVNTIATDDPINPGATRSLTPRTFGEAAINLTGAGIFGANDCTTFGSAYLKSRSSDSFTSALKDFIAPVPVVVSNCGTLTVQKETDPAGDATSFGFTGSPNPALPATFNLSAAGGPRTFSSLLAGTYTLAENDPGSAWQFTSVECKLADGSNANYTTGTRSASVTLAANQNVTCTFKNTKKPTLTVTKSCNPSTDSGKFDLKIGDTVRKADATCAGGAASTTGAVVLDPGNYTVSETAGTGTSLANYDATIGGDCAADGSVSLAAGQNKTCTITNNRKPTLTVNKACNPVGDGGKFKLQIDGTTRGGDASGDSACGGSTGAIVLGTGPHSVGELAGANTALSSYDAVIGGACAADGSVSLAYGENKTCTITNSRKPTLTVNKVCNPVGDGGLFKLQIDGTTRGGDANGDTACGGSTGAVQVSAGAHSVGELAGADTVLSNYDAVINGACAADGSVSLAYGENKTCTITNKRKPMLTVNKVCVPADDTGLFKLKIDDVARGGDANNDLACGGSTGAIVLSPGQHTVSEAAGANTDLSHYTAAINGACSANGVVSLAYGENKTCTITNTKRVFTMIVLVCEGDSLYSSNTTLTNGVPFSATKTLASAANESDLCALQGARYTVGIGTHQPSVTVGSTPAP